MRFFHAALIAVAVLLAGMPAAHAAYSDVPSSYWASDAIAHVAEKNDWMRPSGTKFYPTNALTRRVFAKGLVRAFAPTDTIDPAITFEDLPTSDSWYRYANVAVKRGWLLRTGSGFSPAATISKRTLDRAFTRALGLTKAAAGLSRIKESTGERFKLPSYFAYLVIGGNLRLHYNHPSGTEHGERYPWEAMTRADGAYALWKAALARGTWQVTSLKRYETITLPAMSDGRHRVTEFALRYVGYPYVWAGEWYRATPDGYCCGTQVHGGFDCSGYAWWVLKKAGGGYDNTHIRPYAGWSLPERSSSYIAKAANPKIARNDLKAADIVAFDSDGDGRGTWESVDHLGISLGGGWMVHSSGGRGGVTIDWIGDGWWGDHLMWGRRVYGT